MKWCVHYCKSKCHGIDMIKFPSGREMSVGGDKHQDKWNFCPLCGEPRPKKRTLEEKFIEKTKEFDCKWDTDKWIRELAKIAEEHFKI